MSDERNPGDDYPQDAPPQEGVPQEGYPQQAYPQEGYPQEGYPQEGYPQEGYPQEGIPQEVPAPPGMDVPAPPGMDVPAPPGMDVPAPPALDDPAMAPQDPAAQDWAAQAGPAQPSYPPPEGAGFEQPAQVSEPPPAAEPVAQVEGPDVLAQAPTPAPEEAQPKKKRKIDLKARLSSVRAAGTMAGKGGPPPASAGGSEAGAGFPPPPASGSVPPPRMFSSDGIAPPAALLATSRPAEEKESRPTAAQQTIKVEVGEEVMAERRKTRKRMIIYGIIAAVVTAVLGFFIGQVKAQGDAQRVAVRGASSIIEEIEASSAVLSEMSDALRDGADMLGQEKYPAELGEKLKGMHVPFSADSLTGKKISGLPGSVLQQLLAYAGDVERLNKRKDQLRNLLGIAKKPFEEYLAEKKKPMVRYAVVFSGTNKGMMAELAPLKKPFAEEDKEWPDELPLTRLMRGKPQEVKAKRWTKGDLTGKDPLFIPVDQNTVKGFTSQRMIFDLKKALADTKDLVDGRQSQIPAEQTDGLLKDGEQLIEGLKKVARAGQ